MDENTRDPIITRLERRRGQLEEQRSTWKSDWRDCAKYIAPRKGRFWGEGESANHGGSRTEHILNPSATLAAKKLASGMQGGLTSPARPWFRLALTEQGMSEIGPVRVWLDQVSKAVLEVLGRSNFYDAIYNVYFEQAVFGTACLFIEEDEETLVRFRALTVGEFTLGSNASGRVDTLFRTIRMTARNMAEKFGEEALSRETATALKNAPDTYFDVIHAVAPRKERNSSKQDPDNMPFESVYYEPGGKKPLSVGGFQEFPAPCPRWDTTAGDVYGESPGKDMVKLVALLQNMERSQLKGIHKVLDPPVVKPPEFKKRLNILPGGETEGQADENALRPLYQIRPDIGAVEAKIGKIEQLIRIGFHNDLFQMMSEDMRSGVSATEVVERVQEKMVLVGPVIERQIAELLKPLIERVYAILSRAGALPKPPEAIAGGSLSLEFLSILAQAQKRAGTESLMAFAGFIGQLAALKPEVLDKLNADQIVEEYARAVGVPPQVVAPAEAVKAMREGRAAQEQAMQQAEALKQGTATMRQGADAARSLSQAGVDVQGTAAKLFDKMPMPTGGAA
jgi:hypothetical protein